jgi:hypothetical protein
MTQAANRQTITGIDHPIIAVRDMELARATYERLGFTVTPRGRHQEWGTGNWCIMFETDYLELRGIIDPKNPHNLARILAVREGLMGIALGTSDAEASYASLAERGMSPQPVKHLTRHFELPGKAVELRFALCFLDQIETPGLMSVVLCQHLTRELLRCPEWLQHANGARSMRRVIVVVGDLAAATDSHAKLFGERTMKRHAGRTIIGLGGSQTIELITHDAARAHWAGDDPSFGNADDYLLSLVIDVENVKQTARYLSDRGVDFQPSPSGSLCVQPHDACGVPIEFTDPTSPAV